MLLTRIFFVGFMVLAQSQFYKSIDSQSVIIANPIRQFSLVFLCISVTGTGTEGGERVGRGFDIRRYPLSMYFRTGVVYVFFYFH